LGSSEEQVLAWEERWSRPAGVAALLAVAFVIASVIVAAQVGGGDGDSELLRNVDAHSGTQILSGILQAIGVALLAVPLYVLFTAARRRSDRVRGQLVGVVVAGPLFLAGAAILVGISTVDAATEFVTDVVPSLMEKGVALGSDAANDAASDTISETSLRGLAVGFGIGGQIGFAVGFFYTALQAMRTGLLTRFWGSLGMALGAVSFLFFQFAMLWFVYLGLLLLGWIPGGRPPAWESGEAEPWPSPGEKAAAGMGSSDRERGQGVPDLPPEPSEGGGEPPKKRKQRS
jgi:hypothetical protein